MKDKYEELFDEALKNICTGICGYRMECLTETVIVGLQSADFSRILYFTKSGSLSNIYCLEDVYVAIMQELLDVMATDDSALKESKAYREIVGQCFILVTKECRKRGVECGFKR